MTAIATEPAVETRPFHNGDTVTINHPRFYGQVFVVSHVKRTKAIVKPEGQPAARGVDAPMTMLAHHDPTAPTPRPTPQVRMIPIITDRVGEVVRLKQPFAGNSISDLMVITSVNRTTISLDPLGGVGGRPVRMNPNAVVKVALADILR